MSLLLTAPQCFFIVIFAFAVIGFQRGWRREVITLAFVLSGILLLFANGGRGIADFIFLRIPIIFQDLTANPNRSTPPSPSDAQVFITTFLVFVGIVVLGYFAGNKIFPPPLTPAERVLGAIPSIVSGYAIITYITNTFSKTPLITVGVNTPSQALLSSYMLVIFGISAVLVVIGLIMAGPKKAPPKK